MLLEARQHLPLKQQCTCLSRYAPFLYSLICIYYDHSTLSLPPVTEPLHYFSILLGPYRLVERHLPPLTTTTTTSDAITHF